MKSSKSIVLALLASLLIYVASPLGGFPFGTAYAENEGAVSTIAGIEVGNLSEDEIKQVLTETIDQWSNEPLVISGGGSEVSLSGNIIQFDIDGTIDLYNSMVKKEWYAFWEDEKTVHIPLEALPSEDLKVEISTVRQWNAEETYAQVMNSAGYLKSGLLEAVVEDTSSLEAERIALAIEEVQETAFGTYDIAVALNEWVIGPDETFSFLQAIGENVDVANGEALNFVASLLYQNVLNIDAEIVERHSQQKVPAYLEPGIEAEVDRDGQKDLQFINRMTEPIKLKLSVEVQQLKVEIYTAHQDVTVTTRVVRDGEVKPRTITRYSNDLAVGQVKEIQQGEPGQRVSVYRVIDGVEELVSRDYYPPVNRVLMKSSRELQQTPQTTETDPDLQMDLDGDGLADVEASEGAEEETVVEKDLEVDDDGNPILPPGSYYDKGGNLITP